VGILKRLRGAPIGRHDEKWRMKYNPLPPYDILQNSLIDFPMMQRLKRFSRYFDMIHNSGNFASSVNLIWSGKSPFLSFLDLSDWLFERTGRTSAIALNRLCALLFEYIVGVGGIDKSEAANRLAGDYAAIGRKDLSNEIQIHVTSKPASRCSDKLDIPSRQLRHLCRYFANER
jgi:hypothetical protein